MSSKDTVVFIGGDRTFNEIDKYLTSLKRVDGAGNGKVIADDVSGLSPDLILLDGTLPMSDMTDVIRLLKSRDRTRNVPIITLSDREDTTFRKRAYAAGTDEFLTFPLDEYEVRMRVHTLLRLRKLTGEKDEFSDTIEAEVDRRIYELTQAFEKVKMASLDTVYRLSRAAEYRDDDVGTHIERMSHYSTAIARAMALDEQFVENILWAAPMHDVGKIGVPDNVLLKPGKLDDEEWTIMRQHTTIGFEILKDSTTDFIKLAGEIALNHHEKWDGSGYPNGLAGQDIPLAGRIVALADVFDALTSERPYKKPFSLEESLSIIREGVGSHFDPNVVEAFFSIQDEIIKEFNFWKFMSEESGRDDSESDLLDLF